MQRNDEVMIYICNFKNMLIFPKQSKKQSSSLVFTSIGKSCAVAERFGTNSVGVDRDDAKAMKH